MVIQSVCNFTNNMITPNVSKSFSNAQGDVLSIQISGILNGKVYIEGRNSSNSAWTSLAGIDLSSFLVKKEGFNNIGLYEIGITSIRNLRLRLDGASATDVEVIGQIISTEE